MELNAHISYEERGHNYASATIVFHTLPDTPFTLLYSRIYIPGEVFPMESFMLQASTYLRKDEEPLFFETLANFTANPATPAINTVQKLIARDLNWKIFDLFFQPILEEICLIKGIEMPVLFSEEVSRSANIEKTSPASAVGQVHNHLQQQSSGYI